MFLFNWKNTVYVLGEVDVINKKEKKKKKNLNDQSTMCKQHIICDTPFWTVESVVLSKQSPNLLSDSRMDYMDIPRCWSEKGDKT